MQQGLLSQASVLSVGSTDTSISLTKRGYDLQKALFCTVIGPPPAVDEKGNPLNLDAPPPSDVAYDCEEDLFRQTVLKSQTCASCHMLMNPLAFGINNFDQFGKLRANEPGKPQCKITGGGELYLPDGGGYKKVANFMGPKQLADMAINNGLAEECMAKRILEYNAERSLTTLDRSAILKLKQRNAKAAGFKDFLVEFLLSPEFNNRLEK
jgi:hypothetical protein